jgi:hypothetical protein
MYHYDYKYLVKSQCEQLWSVNVSSVVRQHGDGELTDDILRRLRGGLYRYVQRNVDINRYAERICAYYAASSLLFS